MSENGGGTPRPHQLVVVDDDLSVRTALTRLLRSAGYVVTTYANGDEFLRSSNQDKNSCLILDVQMPGLTGLELQKVINSMRRPLPIIFITAHHDEEIRARAISQGAVGFLEKPFDDLTLIALIQKVTHPNSH